MEMGDKIYTLRMKKGLTLEELGNAVGVGKSTVRKWEKGIISNMKRDKIAKLADALDTTPAFLMGWDENRTKSIPSINITDNLKHIMSLQNNTVEEIAKKSGISQKEIEDILNGKPAPLIYIKPLSDALNVLTKFLDYYTVEEITLESLEDSLSTKIAVKITNLLLALNANGLKEAYKRVEELTYIPKYTSKTFDDEKNNLTVLNAAHERTDVEVTDDMKQQDDAFFDEED